MVECCQNLEIPEIQQNQLIIKDLMDIFFLWKQLGDIFVGKNQPMKNWIATKGLYGEKNWKSESDMTAKKILSH